MRIKGVSIKQLGCSCVAVLLVASCGKSGVGTSGSGSPPSPVVAAFAPTIGSAGVEVRITGINFGTSPGGDTVTFNGTAATVISASATEVVAAVPSGATTGQVNVTTSGGGSNGPGSFTVVPTSATPGVTWTTRAQGQNGAIAGLAASGSLIVAVGDANAILSSSDGVHWAPRTQTPVFFFGVTWTGSQFVAVGEFGVIYTSTDGITWTQRVNGAGGIDLNAAAASPSIIVAVGGGGLIRSSPDGQTWTTRVSSAITMDTLNAVVWSGTQFVAVGASGAIRTSPDGITWTTRGSGQTNSLLGVAWSGSVFAAVGTPSTILTSPDGITWTPRTLGVSGSLNGVTWTGSFFLAVGLGGLTATSPDGTTWTPKTNTNVGMTTTLSVAWTGSQLVAGGSDGNGGVIHTSTDGVTWTPRLTDARFAGVAWSGSRFVVVGDAGFSATSTDGLSWSYGNIDLQGGTIVTPFADVVWHAGTTNLFVAVTTEAANGRVATSSDGITWTRAASQVGSPGALASSGTLLVHAGVGGTGIATSPDGGTWTPRTNPSAAVLKGATWTGTQFIAVGNSGTILTSPDGTTWTPQTSNTTQGLNGVAACGTAHAAVGNSGTVLSSSDGVAWTVRASGVTQTLRRVRCVNNQLVTAGASAILFSADGATWSQAQTDFLDFFDVAGSVGRIVAVGGPGLIVTSP